MGFKGFKDHKGFKGNETRIVAASETFVTSATFATIAFANEKNPPIDGRIF